MSRYPWRDTSTDIAGGQPPQWETPQGAQAKADEALKEAKDYTDQQNAGFTEHIEDTTIHVTPADKINWNSKAPGVHTHANATPTTPGFMSADDKTKLDGVEDEANKYVHPSTHPPAIIAQDAANRFVTDAEKAAWNGKAETTEATTSVKGLMSPTDKQKLSGIQAAAEVNQNAFSGVNGVAATSKTDTLQITGGTGITITEDPANKRLTVTATGDATPGAHATSHITGGTDVIPNAVTGGASGLMSGADAQFVRVNGESKIGAQEKADAALVAANEYTDGRVAEIVIDDASLTQKGVVQLSSSTGSNSETEAATPKALNTVRQQADAKIGDLTQLQTTDKDSLVDALNEVFTHVDEGKELVKTAVIVKGGTVVGTSPHSFQQLADGIDTIETSTVINGQMKQSITFGESIQAFDPVVTYEGFLNNNTISGGLPTGTGRGATWTPDGVYLAISCQEAPFLSIYKKSAEGIFIKLANPAILPTGIAIDAAFSPDGVYLAVAHVTSPFITVYKRTGDTFTKLANPILPADYTWSVAWSPDSVYLAVGVSSSGSVPSIALYKRNGDSLNKINNPSSYPAATIYGVAFSPSGTYLAVASGISPYLMVYRRTGDSFVALSAPTIIPGSTMYYVSWHPSETMLAIGGAAGQTTPALSLYRFSGSLLTKINDSDDLPSNTINRLTFSPDGKLLSTANGGAASVRFVSYRVVGETLIKLPDPEFLLPAAGYAIAYSPNSQYLAIGYQGGNYLSIFTINTEARKSTNAIADLKKALSAGYAIESGSAGETKEIITIWRS